MAELRIQSLSSVPSAQVWGPAPRCGDQRRSGPGPTALHAPTSPSSPLHHQAGGLHWATHRASLPRVWDSWPMADPQGHPAPAAGARGWVGLGHRGSTEKWGLGASWGKSGRAGRGVGKGAGWETGWGALAGAPHALGPGPQAAAGHGRGPVRRAGQCRAAVRAGSAWGSQSRCCVQPGLAAGAPLALGSALGGYLVARVGHRLGDLQVGCSGTPHPPWYEVRVNIFPEPATVPPPSHTSRSFKKWGWGRQCRPKQQQGQSLGGSSVPWSRDGGWSGEEKGSPGGKHWPDPQRPARSTCRPRDGIRA